MDGLDPLLLSVDVACSAEHAFRVWTDRIAQWWPSDHTVSGDPALRVVLQPRVGGRIYEVTSTGVEHDWGEVTVWEPPRRVSYLWHLRRDRADATDVEITFVPVAEHATRVEIVHSAWERLGADAQTWRNRNFGGWSAVLPHFVAAATDDPR